METKRRGTTASVFIAVGAIAQSFGFALLILAALAALGLDRSGYPLISELGHPAWIAVGAGLGIFGGIISGYGYFLILQVFTQHFLERVRQ